jgi:PBSX family phage terminase large subunit
MWAMETFNGQNFAMCGKTIGSFRRNVWFWLKLILICRGYGVDEIRNENLAIISKKGKSNYFYIFGGKDERSQDLIQGITLAGLLMDEVALMPESFVKQATARCSVEGSKFWFNCNPEGPFHYFKIEWIDKCIEKNLLLLHFTMDDNLSLSEKIKNRYKAMYSGIFYKRFILGLWVLADGIIYDMFSEDKHVVKTEDRQYIEYYVSCDYGTYNACCFGLYGKANNKSYKIKEYYYDGRTTGRQKTDEEYVNDLVDFIGGIHVKGVIVDPSASSFITAIKKKGKYTVLKARNEVLEGIKAYATALNQGTLLFNDCCVNSFREFSAYIWDLKAAERGEDKPLKQNDHTKDEERYYVNTILNKRSVQYLK